MNFDFIGSRHSLTCGPGVVSAFVQEHFFVPDAAGRAKKLWAFFCSGRGWPSKKQEKEKSRPNKKHTFLLQIFSPAKSLHSRFPIVTAHRFTPEPPKRAADCFGQALDAAGGGRHRPREWPRQEGTRQRKRKGCRRAHAPARTPLLTRGFQAGTSAPVVTTPSRAPANGGLFRRTSLRR